MYLDGENIHRQVQEMIDRLKGGARTPEYRMNY